MHGQSNIVQQQSVLTRVLAEAELSKVNGVIKNPSTGRTPNWPKIVTEYTRSVGFLDQAPLWDDTTIAAMAVSLLPEMGVSGGTWNPTYETVNTVEDLITQGLREYDIILGPNGESIRRSGIDVSYDVVEALLKEHCREYEEDSTIPGQKEKGRKVFQPTRIGDALKVYISNSDIHARTALRNSLRYNEDNGAKAVGFHMIKRVMELFQVKEDHDLATVMMMQWMWQTKRYAMGMEVLEPFMINFMGSAQGTMKTSFIEALTTPFKQYRVPTAKLKAVLDEREYTLWAKKYVVIFDELQKGRMAKNEFGELVAAMKSLLTSKSVGGRVMKTTQHVEMQRIFSPISSSNASIISVIRDRSGMRRFFEINVMSNIKAHPELIPIVNALLDPAGVYAGMVWTSINENLPHGYVEVDGWKERLNSVQDTYKITDSVDLWINSADVRFVPVSYTDYNEEVINKRIAELRECSVTSTDIDALNTSISPMEWRLDYVLTKECTEWVEEEMGRNAASYVGGREHMVQYLEGNGKVVIQKGINTYVLCQTPSLSAMADAGGLA